MQSEQTQNCIPRDIEKEKEGLPEVIYLVPESDGEFGEYWAWSDEACPTTEHVAAEAVRYVRAKD